MPRQILWKLWVPDVYVNAMTTVSVMSAFELWYCLTNHFDTTAFIWPNIFFDCSKEVCLNRSQSSLLCQCQCCCTGYNHIWFCSVVIMALPWISAVVTEWLNIRPKLIHFSRKDNPVNNLRFQDFSLLPQCIWGLRLPGMLCNVMLAVSYHHFGTAC